jgi:uncharacterized RDD family membrane protein YckC
VVAAFIDALIVGFPVVILTALAGLLLQTQSVLGVLAAVAVYLVAFAAGIVYYVYFWSAAGNGQTLGMKALDLHVLRSDGQRLTAGRAFGRYCALTLAYSTCYIGVIMVAFTERKQGLHDMICDTIVVKETEAT